MAASFKMSLQEEDSLRKKNRALIYQLQNDIEGIKENLRIDNFYNHKTTRKNESFALYPCQMERKSSTARRRNLKSEKTAEKMNRCRKANSYFDALNDAGNLKLPSSQCNITNENLKSILCTPRQNSNTSSSKDTKSQGYNVTPARLHLNKIPKKHVCFSSTTRNNQGHQSSRPVLDTSMMGYDWIAHMVDNKSGINEHSEKFFEEIEEFRRENLAECNSLSTQDNMACRHDEPKEKKTMKTIIIPDHPPEEIPLCCTGDGAYVLNNRCNLIPVHGPYSQCPVCKQKSKSLGSEDKCIRVSIPRSTIQSTSQVKHHRRSSFDPTESVALASHCLAGWESSKPAYVRGRTAIDMTSDLTTLKSQNNTRHKMVVT